MPRDEHHDPQSRAWKRTISANTAPPIVIVRPRAVTNVTLSCKEAHDVAKTTKDLFAERPFSPITDTLIIRPDDLQVLSDTFLSATSSKLTIAPWLYRIRHLTIWPPYRGGDCTGSGDLASFKALVDSMAHMSKLEYL